MDDQDPTGLRRSTRVKQQNTTLDTEGVLGEVLHRLKNARGRALALLNSKRKEIDDLMKTPMNVNLVRVEIIRLQDLATKFDEAHLAYHDLLTDNSQEKTDSSEYYKNIEQDLLDYSTKINEWQSKVETSFKADDDGLNLGDSASQTSTKTRRSKESTRSNLSEARMKEAAKLAELQAKASTLKHWRSLEEEELRLKQEELKLKLKREELKIETELAKSKAREKAYADLEEKESLIGGSRPKRESTFPVFKSEPKAEDKREPEERHVQWKTPIAAENSAFHRQTYNILEQQNRIMEEIVRHQQRNKLPQRHMPIFGGDPLEYCSFIRAFDTLIDAREPDASCKIYYLEQYTTGRAKELIRSCLHMKPEEGYLRARELLEDRFGQPHNIAMAHVERLVRGPPIKQDDGNALDNFAIALTSCKNSLESIGYLSKIENPDSMKKIIDRLPYKLQEKWREVADYIMNVRKRDVNIEDIADFVSQKARMLNNPIFGKLSPRFKRKVDEKMKPTTHNLPSMKSSFATNEKERFAGDVTPTPSNTVTKPKICPVCDKEHWIVDCPVFKEKSLDERLDLVRKKRLCFACLRRGHQSMGCFKRKPCQKCEKKHATLLHREDSTSENVKVPNAADKDKKSEVTKEASGLMCSEQVTQETKKDFKTLLPVVPVKVKKSDDCQYIETYALLDTGSSSTFCTDNLLRRLCATGKKSKIKLSTIGGTKEFDTMVVNNLKVADLDENHVIPLPEVISRPNIPVSKDEIPVQEDLSCWPQFQGYVDLPDVNSEVDLLIGVNVPDALEPKEVISTDGGPYAIRSKLGWAVNGPIEKGKRNVQPGSKCFFSKAKTNEHLCSTCTDLMDAYSDDTQGLSREDMKFMDIMERTINHLDSQHYEIALPLRDPSLQLPNNKIQAERRATYLKHKLSKNHKFKEDYVEFMNNTIKSGHAKKIPPEQLSETCNKIWYIPHHGIYHKKKPDKIRVVFDCSAKFQGLALNDILLKGPDLTNKLIGVLIRFRQELFAVMADVQGMFHQVFVAEPDRNMLRFLWWPEGNLDQDLEEYQMTVHLFGAISSPSCANFALRRTADDNKSRFHQQVIDTVHKNFYVDDCLKSVSTLDAAISLVKDLCLLLELGGFRLTKWMSNKKEVLQVIPEDERAKGVKELDFDQDSLPVERALGVTWDTENDTFGFKITPKSCQLTRRGLLSVVSSVYDPLGLVAPFTIQAKILLQDLTRMHLDWDEEIPQDCQLRWKKWLTELTELNKFSTERCIKSTNFGDVSSSQLHHFSDASLSAYGTASYVRMVNEQGQVHCSLLFGKARLAPLKQLTIPRLELAAAALSVRSDRMLRQELELQVEESVFWTDSTTVLHYIENESKRFHTYVSNRVAFIRDNSNPLQWKYVDSSSNPADDCSRGVPIHKFLQSSRWIMGPEFLWKPECEWPTKPEMNDSTLRDDPEVKKEFKSCAAVTQPPRSTLSLGSIFEKFSSWWRLKKFIARCIKCQRNFKQRNKNSNSSTQQNVHKVSLIEPLTVEELQRAEYEIFRHIQSQAYSEEIQALTSGKNVKKSSNILKLDPVLVDGLIRVGGRLSRSSLPYDMKHQVIIPKGNHVSKLIIKDLHQKSGHSGREYVLSLLRQRFWIVQANSAVRNVISRCYDCKRRHSTHGEQKMADLPAARIASCTPPFTYVGIDYFGPFLVRLKRSMVKRYGVIFTCLTVRAVHLEISSTLTTDSFILALRRFIARRGQVKEIYSDNGTNLVGGERELREAIAEWNQAQIHESLLQREIKWNFNPPSASHFGGSWERCIRTVRKILMALLKDQVLEDEGLLTLMSEVEAIINGRPLTKVSSDPQDAEPITPNHLLLLKEDIAVPPGLFEVTDSYARKRWKQVQYMSDIFWKRWTREYLPILQQRQKWYFPKRNLATDDIVLVIDESSPRNCWKIGRIIEVFPDVKGFVRRVRIKTKTGIFDRPTSKTCLLEAAV